MLTKDKVLNLLKLEQKLEVAVESHSDKRVLVTQDKVQSAPHFAGGGIVFAPKPRDYSYVLPKKVKRAALKSALSAKVKNSEMIVLESLELAAPKTKDMVALLNNLKVAGKALVVTVDKNDNVVFSANNLQGVSTSFVGQLNVYEILNHTSLVITKAAVEKLEEVYA